VGTLVVVRCDRVLGCERVQQRACIEIKDICRKFTAVHVDAAAHLFGVCESVSSMLF
jgi:hypothetical protein